MRHLPLTHLLSLSAWLHLDSAGISLSPLHFQPAQHACAAVMWPNRRQPLRRAARNTPAASGWPARAGWLYVRCCGKKVWWAC
jgi:hypothetical protein